MYTIPILKQQIPYQTKLELGGGVFFLKFKYNLFDNRVYTDLLDINENTLVEDEPIVFGVPLFLRFYIDSAGNIRNKFPKVMIIPNYLDGESTEKITFDNIETVRLYVEDL